MGNITADSTSMNCDIDHTIHQTLAPVVYVMVLVVGFPANCLSLYYGYLQIKARNEAGCVPVQPDSGRPLLHLLPPSGCSRAAAARPLVPRRPVLPGVRDPAPTRTSTSAWASSAASPSTATWPWPPSRYQFRTAEGRRGRQRAHLGQGAADQHLLPHAQWWKAPTGTRLLEHYPLEPRQRGITTTASWWASSSPSACCWPPRGILRAVRRSRGTQKRAQGPDPAASAQHRGHLPGLLPALPCCCWCAASGSPAATSPRASSMPTTSPCSSPASTAWPTRALPAQWMLSCQPDVRPSCCSTRWPGPGGCCHWAPEASGKSEDPEVLTRLHPAFRPPTRLEWEGPPRAELSLAGSPHHTCRAEQGLSLPRLLPLWPRQLPLAADGDDGLGPRAPRSGP